MSVTIVTLPHPSVDDGTISQWRKDHPSRKLINDPEEYQSPRMGLFGFDPGTEIKSEFIPVKTLRDILKKNEGDDVLILMEKPVKGKIDAEVKNLSFPAKRDIPSFVAKRTGVSVITARKIVSVYDNPASALSVAQQLSLTDSGDPISGVIDPFRGDAPPWLIIDAIFNGRPDRAAKETRQVINVTRDPIGLFFQISGFLRKTIVAEEDNGSDYFKKRYRSINDMRGIVDDISYYSEKILNAQKSVAGMIVIGFTASVASRCIR